MKKLLALASAAVIGFSLHASSFIWGFQSSETVDPDGAYFGEGKYADASAFLYLGTATPAGGKLDISALTLIASVGAMNPDPDYNWGVFDTASMASHDSVVASAGATGQAYTLVLVAKDGLSALNDGDTYQMVVVTGTSSITAVPGAGDTTYYADFVNGTQFAAGDWKSTAVVPEPTSGLLMLLGMAGLALRRRRA